MPTIKELLLQIPEHGEAAVRNFLEQDIKEGTSLADLECDSIPKALQRGFCWEDTPEKDEFWMKVYFENGGKIMDFFCY